MKAEVDLVTVGGGNIASVKHCFERMGVRCNVIGHDSLPDGSRPVVLPGVGSFGAVMENLRRGGTDKRVVELVRAGTPYLGICVGMQILFDGSEESLDVPGLSLLPGRVVRFKQGKVPQIGWNRIENAASDESGYVYFVNSYYPQPEKREVVSYRADYFGEFCAAVESDNVTAFQFHPEKSGAFGQKLLRGWINNGRS